MKRFGLTLRMSLGGAVCGSYLGIALGAIAGVAYGLWTDDLSYGISGAMIGGGVAAAGGALVGLGFGVDEARKENEPGATLTHTFEKPAPHLNQPAQSRS